jgi:hypothetical protein
MAEIEMRMNLPADHATVSHIVGMSGKPYLVRIDSDGTRWCTMLQKDCEALLTSSQPSNAPWRDANPALFQRFGGKVSKPEVGINIARYMAAHTAPAPRSPFDKGGQVNDTLRTMGHMRRQTR